VKRVKSTRHCAVLSVKAVVHIAYHRSKSTHKDMLKELVLKTLLAYIITALFSFSNGANRL